MIHKTILQRLDDAANWTGVPKLAGQVEMRRRSMRWLPIVLLAAAFAGCVVCYAGPDHHAIGQLVATMSFVVSVWLPLFGPLKPWGALDGVDERERDLRRRAFLITLAIIAIVATVALLILPVLALLGQWQPDTLMRRAMTLGFALLTIFNALPTLYASWATRPLPDED
jgi:uncharacterized membrane protein